MLIERGHHSVLEHESISVKFIVDRGVTHELVRHRLASFSQESTRYCNYGGQDIAFIKPVCLEEGTLAYTVWLEAMKTAEVAYQCLLHPGGASPQVARAVLPNSLKAEIVMTANIREWRHVLTLRTSPAAHPDMRHIMLQVLTEFKRLWPVLFEDISS